MVISLLQFIHTFIIMTNTEHVNEHLETSINEDEIVRIQISILQLFKNFKFSAYLLVIYSAYCFMMMRYEISHLVSPTKYCEYFVSVPILYVLIDYVSNRIMVMINNWYLLCIFILTTQIITSVVESLIRFYFAEWLLPAFLIFTFNMILMQKVVFISINSTMLQIFEVDNLRVRNYLSCILTSNRKQSTCSNQYNFTDFFGVILRV